MNAKPTLALACLLAAGAAFAQDRSNPDGNTDAQNPRNPIPQGPGTPPFGHGQPPESRFTPKKDEADGQTRAAPTDRDGTRPENAGSPTQAQPDARSAGEPQKKPKKRKKSREQPMKKRGAGRAPRRTLDKELPAVTDPSKDGSLIEEGEPHPHD